MINLLCYPRSGSSLFRYYLGFLTESKPMQPQGHCEMDFLLEKHYKKDGYITKFHGLRDLRKRRGGKKLCLLYRDPLENILSYSYSDLNQNNKGKDLEYKKESVNNIVSTKKITPYVRMFEENINFYHSWEGDKIIVRYDELINDTYNCLHDVKDFFSFTDERLELLTNNLTYHNNLVLNFKTNKNDPFEVNTKGKNLKLFSELLESDKLENFKNLLNGTGLYL